MASSPAPSFPSSSALPLPTGFSTVEEIRNTKPGTFVNVIGFVKDHRPPFKTAGTDFKCTIGIKDFSVQFESAGLDVVIFWAEHLMPRISGVGDAVLIRKAKVQLFKGSIQLIANKYSEFQLLPCSTIPRKPINVPPAIWQSTPALARKPSATETNYIIALNAQKEDLNLPSNEEYQTRTAQATNIRDKFSLLKDVEPDKYYSILGQVVRVFDGEVGRVTAYLSDYTAHPKFFNNVWDPMEGANKDDVREKDEYGNYPKPKETWPGPYGRMSIQLTLFENQADYFREHVKVDQIVLLTNVRIKFAKMGGCLEGSLHADQTVHVEVIDPIKASEAKGDDTDRLKEHIRRKRDYWTKFKKQRQDIFEDAMKSGEKRKRNNDDEGGKGNSKQRRKEKRAAAAKKAAEADAKRMEKLDLNENIRCQYPDRPTFPLSKILKHHVHQDRDSGQQITLPFIVANYRANVQVVSYFPSKIEDFAISRQVSEYDILSDHSGGESSDQEEFNRSWAAGRGAPKKVWEWRFSLEVEDASKKGPKERMWLLVDNPAAQALLDMDAVNLRSRDSKDKLQELREKLCILWGDLEEQKAALEPQDSTMQSRHTFSSTYNTEPPSSPPFMKAGAQPNLDSDDENDVPVKRPSAKTILTERDVNAKLTLNGKSVNIEKGGDSIPPVIHNKAFTCCIRQYGIKVKEKDPTKANALEGKRWERKFGLWGVVIV